MCSHQTCLISGTKHIAWNIRLRAPGKNWFTPSLGLHFFMFIAPVLSIFQIKSILAVILTGPYLGIILTKNKDERERGAIWCYTAIMQILLTYYLLK